MQYYALNEAGKHAISMFVSAHCKPHPDEVILKIAERLALESFHEGIDTGRDAAIKMPGIFTKSGAQESLPLQAAWFEPHTYGMTYGMLLQILEEAEDRVRTISDPGVRERSQETVELVHERLRREGLTVQQLKQLAKEDQQ
jgi:hypothetical protein